MKPTIAQLLAQHRLRQGMTPPLAPQPCAGRQYYPETPILQEANTVSHAEALYPGMQPYPGYQLRQLLGRGGFGEVWEAQTNDGSLIALKFLPCSSNLAASKEIRSIQAIRQLRHPNLVRIDQVWCQRGYIVVAMELAEGSLLDLFDAYRNEMGTAIPPEQVCLYLTQVASALDFLNKRQHAQDGQRVSYQHCDIKPSNLLLFGDTVKLCDFGLSSATTAKVKFHSRAGTLDYAAPEIFQGRLSEWSDQYSLAVSYCLLRGGQLPFPESPRSFRGAYTRPAPDLSTLSPAERPIVARALSVIPHDRWPTCGEFMAQVSRVLLR
ncbi:MAG: serine/threonine-protein kinase [Gemmataceae bacterium]